LLSRLNFAQYNLPVAENGFSALMVFGDQVRTQETVLKLAFSVAIGLQISEGGSCFGCSRTHNSVLIVQNPPGKAGFVVSRRF
jgi:hypothetical protein